MHPLLWIGLGVCIAVCVCWIFVIWLGYQMWKRW